MVVDNYKAKVRIIEPHKTIYTPAATLKLYTMFPQGNERPESADLARMRKAILQEVSGNKQFDPRLGIGYAVVSEDILNIFLWGGEYPSLLNPHVYEYGALNQVRLKRGSLEEMGTLCAWEGEITGHESRAWQRCLHFGRTQGAEREYLNNKIAGPTSDILLYETSDMPLTDFFPMLSTKARKGIKRMGLKTIADLQYVEDRDCFPRGVGEVTIGEYLSLLTYLGKDPTWHNAEPKVVVEPNPKTVAEAVKEARRLAQQIRTTLAEPYRTT